MKLHLGEFARVLADVALGVALFAGGYAAGQNKFGQPKTVLHLVILKWNPGVSDTDKQLAIEGVKAMAAKMPGIKNIWLKADRIQPRDFNAAYAIEFKDRAAADAYAESPLHEAWEKQYVAMRQASISEQVTNP